MSITILDFEKPIAEVSSKIEALQLAASDNPELLPQIDKLKTQEISLRKKIYSKLTTWQKVQVARHPNRPHTLDFIERIFDETPSQNKIILTTEKDYTRLVHHLESVSFIGIETAFLENNNEPVSYTHLRAHET